MFSIARSTSRLTRAVREVAKGNLEHRVPVKRRDQLGDLGLAFNAMIDAVHTMLAEVAEKQRLADEMAMAREIQQSLLPETTVEHAGLVVQAHFRPATEVGGDYFDIFRLDAGRLLVCVGDVAGHGLSTGLLMAMVKSALGTLVQEGHRGAELVERVNRLLLQQGTRQRMATLLVAEIDTIAARVELCSAGHPPAFVLRPGGAVEEILLSSLPLGTHLPAEPATSSLGFPRGSTLVLYSDGLIEAVGANGELGFAGLNDALQRGRGLAPARLLAALLSELDRHVEGRSLGDDLTLVVVGSNG
jgi:sigma-B regulation protein RsbU (phosphoserine phosphatase)